MKLSEMNTIELSKTLCKLAEPIGRIGADAAINNIFKDFSKENNGKTLFQSGTEVYVAIVPALLERHQEDTFSVISAMTGKSVDEIRAQNGMETIRDIKCFFDNDLMSFFKSST